MSHFYSLFSSLIVCVGVKAYIDSGVLECSRMLHGEVTRNVVNNNGYKVYVVDDTITTKC